jgi:hypothetical protein
MFIANQLFQWFLPREKCRMSFNGNSRFAYAAAWRLVDCPFEPSEYPNKLSKSFSCISAKGLTPQIAFQAPNQKINLKRLRLWARCCLVDAVGVSYEFLEYSKKPIENNGSPRLSSPTV